MRVSDFFAPAKSATPATRADAEAALRSTVDGDVTSETPTTEIVSGEGDAVLHDTIVQDAPEAGETFEPGLKACGCPEGECRGVTPETVQAAADFAEQKAKAEGVSPGEDRFGEILQSVMDETFGKGIVTVSGPFDGAQETDETSLSVGFDETNDTGKSEEDRFFEELMTMFSKASSENVQRNEPLILGGGNSELPPGLIEAILGPAPKLPPFLPLGNFVKGDRFDDTYRNTERPDPFPFFTALDRGEADFTGISSATAAQIEQDRRDELDDEAFDQERREVVQSLADTMAQLTRLATQVYGE
jgi:hypothetical protein